MANLVKKNLFIANLHGLNQRSYGVSIKHFKNEETVPYKRMDYEAQITLQQQENGWLFSLQKSNIFFNRHEPHLISERFGSIVSQSLYPVQTIINGWGKQVAGIINQQEIIKRWHSNKQKITGKYEGETVNDFINAIDKKMSDSATIQRAMQYDLFWNLFFHPKYMEYTHTYQQAVDLYLSIIPYKSPVRFTGIQEIIPVVTNYNAVQILFKSQELKAPKEVAGVDDCMMKLHVDFDLDKEHHFAMHTRAVFDVYKREGKYTVKPMKKLQFTMYQL